MPPLSRYFPGWKKEETNSIRSGQTLNYKSYETAHFLGYFNGEQREGLGVVINKEGRLVVGEWRNDVYNGSAITLHHNGGYFEGECIDGKANGYGRILFEIDYAYEGNFKNDYFSGKGTMTWPNGAKYNGDFLDGKRHGQGTEI